LIAAKVGAVHSLVWITDMLRLSEVSSGGVGENPCYEHMVKVIFGCMMLSAILLL